MARPAAGLMLKQKLKVNIDEALKQMMLASVDSAFSKIDTDDDGFVSFSEMHETIMNDANFDFPAEIQKNGGGRAAMIERYFRMLDEDHDGLVTREEMRKCCERIIEEQLEAMAD